MSQARELASNIPGGELVIEEQEQIVQMLEQLRDRKKYRTCLSTFCLSNSHLSFRNLLARFSQQPLTSVVKPTASIKMEIDSTASTPTAD